jgi:hypothetical protein
VAGPGSLFTSVLPNLLVQDIQRALWASPHSGCTSATWPPSRGKPMVLMWASTCGPAPPRGGNLFPWVLANSIRHRAYGRSQTLPVARIMNVRQFGYRRDRWPAWPIPQRSLAAPSRAACGGDHAVYYGQQARVRDVKEVKTDEDRGRRNDQKCRGYRSRRHGGGGHRKDEAEWNVSSLLGPGAKMPPIPGVS